MNYILTYPKNLDRGIKFASKHTNISAKEIKIILHAKKSLMFHNNEQRIKKSCNNFDVTMGSFIGAETCELVGAMILNELNNVYKDNSGLYRSDRLAVFNTTPRILS